MKEINNETWAKNYLNAGTYPTIRLLHNFYQRYFFKFIKDKNMKILDVGCGAGSFLFKLYSMGYLNIYGIEPDEELLKVINSSFPDNIKDRVKKGLATDLPFENETFDCINFFNVLHHLKNSEDYIKTVNEINRCLKKAGYVVIVEPCNGFIYSIKRFIVWLFRNISKKCLNIYKMMSKEKKDVAYFYKNSYLFRDEFIKKKFNIIYDRKIFHQWIIVVQK